MNQNEAAAVLMCRAASALARIAGMQAENQQRMATDNGHISYDEAAFLKVVDEEQIGQNDVYDLIQRATMM